MLTEEMVSKISEGYIPNYDALFDSIIEYLDQRMEIDPYVPYLFADKDILSVAFRQNGAGIWTAACKIIWNNVEFEWIDTDGKFNEFGFPLQDLCTEKDIWFERVKKELGPRRYLTKEEKEEKERNKDISNMEMLIKKYSKEAKSILDALGA